MVILILEKKLSCHEFEEDRKKREEKMGVISATQKSINTLLSNLKDRLGRVEKELQLLNGVANIQESLKSLDSYLQQVLVKINLNQASILDLSKYESLFVNFQITFLTEAYLVW